MRLAASVRHASFMDLSGWGFRSLKAQPDCHVRTPEDRSECGALLFRMRKRSVSGILHCAHVCRRPPEFKDRTPTGTYSHCLWLMKILHGHRLEEEEEI